MRRRDRRERLLDGALAAPLEVVEDRARLVVGARLARAAKRLLAHRGAGALVVDVEVARRVDERGLGRAHRAAVLGEDGAGERVPVT